jgi:hypothetical protein
MGRRLVAVKEHGMAYAYAARNGRGRNSHFGFGGCLINDW